MRTALGWMCPGCKTDGPSTFIDMVNTDDKQYYWTMMKLVCDACECVHYDVVSKIER